MATEVARLHSINPATGEEIEAFDVASGDVIDARLDAAVSAAARWRDTPIARRTELLRELARVLRRDVAVHAATITAEMGKPISEARAEVEKCAFCCEYFAGSAQTFLADEPAPSDSPASFIRYEPFGVLLACMPWNFPYWQVFRCIAPALAAGNTVVLKHASNVTRCGMRIEEAVRDAGIPDSVFSFLPVPASGVARLISDRRISAVSLTGSTDAGRKVAAVAGENIKKCVLELGGSDAFVVLADADLSAAAEVGARSRFQNTGQSCISAKRFIVLEAVAEEFEERRAAEASRIRLGDPTRDETQMGPLARADLRE
ncbi:MAG TPA: aldehyde dehydrogenase family protein, partial [Candidatus Dormibacteraeota bacterium]|nr:aldehyde dehydrogenase family protein [Candidatus Dormibacteraeota bacterium]